jgi:protein transport protein SEC24
MAGARVDLENRPELRFGTVDFAVPRAYWAENPKSLLDSAGLSSTGDLLASLNQAVAATTGSAPMEKDKSQRQKEKQREEQLLRSPMPIGRVFAIDVSWNASKAGLIQECCRAIKEALYGDRASAQDGTDEEPSASTSSFQTPAGRVAIVTYDRALHFYDLAVRVPYLPNGHGTLS